jgi:hypothetical protein
MNDREKSIGRKEAQKSPKDFFVTYRASLWPFLLDISWFQIQTSGNLSGFVIHKIRG